MKFIHRSCNKKILNATPNEYNGISFKSILEKTAYKCFLENGFSPQYEPKKFTIWDGFYPTVPFYDVDKQTKALTQLTTKIIGITYTPDFILEYNDYTIYIEMKSIENDVFYIKKKLFRAWLETHNPKSMYFEIHNKGQLLQAINIIKNLKQ